MRTDDELSLAEKVAKFPQHKRDQIFAGYTQADFASLSSIHDRPGYGRSGPLADGPVKMPGFAVLTGVRKEASKMGSRRPLRSVGTQITELTATRSAQLKRSQVHASAITRAYQQHPQPDRKSSKHPGVLVVFASQRKGA